MNPWVDRGRLFLAIIFGAMLLTYLGERLVYYAVTGFSLSLSSVVVVVLLIGMGFLITRGFGWLRWILALFFILNGLGSPRGMADVFGAPMSMLLSLGLLVAHVGCALALCLTPGIPAFLRYQRQQRTAPATNSHDPPGAPK